MSLKDILSGHIKEFTGSDEELFQERINICKDCPLYTVSKKFGPICDRNKWYLKSSNKTYDYYVVNSINGCGCRLNAKLRNDNATCVLNKF